jgi:hypothetical protein
MPPLFIMGCKRTGTRMFAKIAERLGVYFGDKKDLPDNYEHPVLETFMAEQNAELITNYFASHHRWGIKHPSLTEFLPLLHTAFPAAQVLFSTREYINPTSLSQADAYKVNAQGEPCWDCFHKSFDKKQARKLERMREEMPRSWQVQYVSYDDFVADPPAGLTTLAQFLQVPILEGDTGWVKQFVYPHRSARFNK